jgi:hypothetical protein
VAWDDNPLNWINQALPYLAQLVQWLFVPNPCVVAQLSTDANTLIEGTPLGWPGQFGTMVSEAASCPGFDSDILYFMTPADFDDGACIDPAALVRGREAGLRTRADAARAAAAADQQAALLASGDAAYRNAAASRDPRLSSDASFNAAVLYAESHSVRPLSAETYLDTVVPTYIDLTSYAGLIATSRTVLLLVLWTEFCLLLGGRIIELVKEYRL